MRRGKNRAVVAVAHSMVIAIYHMLKDGEVFKDLGVDYYMEHNPQRKIAYHLKNYKHWAGLCQQPLWPNYIFYRDFSPSAFCAEGAESRWIFTAMTPRFHPAKF